MQWTVALSKMIVDRTKRRWFGDIVKFARKEWMTKKQTQIYGSSYGCISYDKLTEK